MDIHTEKAIEEANARDSLLMKKMLRFAKPYAKQIVWSIVLGALVVLATLAQPYLIKIVIDDRINGVYKPMIRYVADDEQVEPWLKQHESKLERREVEWDGYIYRRFKDTLPGEIDVPPQVEKMQIIGIESERYLIHGWLIAAEDDVYIDRSGGKTTVAHGTQVYPTEVMTEEQFRLFREQDYIGFAYIGVLFFVVIVGAAFLNYAQMNLLQNTGQRIIFDIRQKMFRHLSRMHIGYFDRNPVGRLVTRVSHDVEALNQLYSQVIVNLVKEVSILVGIVFIMLHMSVKLTLITFTVIPILVVITVYYRTIVRDAHRYTRLVLSRLNSFLAENLSGMHIIQIFNREKKQLKRFDEMNEEYYRAGVRATTINSIFNPTIGFLGDLALAVLVWYGGKSVLAGTVTFGAVYAFTQYVQQFYKPLMGLADRYNQIQTAMASAERIFELLEEEPAIQNPEKPVRLPPKLKGKIEFDRVWFAYNENEWVLKDISFEVEPGETVAFVGATGAGKSSIINLITRFYDVNKGSIRIDGHDVRDMALDDLRRRVAMIQQDSFVFTGDVRFNIRLNRKDIRDADVRRLARRFHMDEFIEELPDKYDTLLGEQGVTLSSGQQQLLSFLRAAAFNPDILILDEATAHVDTETEQIVQEALKKISRGRTTLIVAHRLSTIQHADKIIVMHKGQIREMGNHYQLLKKRGLYYRLYEVQSRERRGVPTRTLM